MIFKLDLKNLLLKRIFFTLSGVATVIVLSLLYGCGSSSNAPRKSPEQNVVYRYENNSPIKINHTATFSNNTYTIYLAVNVRRLRSEKSVSAFSNNIKLSYLQRRDFETPALVKVDSIPSNQLNIEKRGEAYICKISIPRTSDFPPYVIFKAKDKRTEYEATEDVQLETEGKSNYWNSILFDLNDSIPVFTNYISLEKKYRLIGESNSNQLFVNQIKQEFPPAPAPMSSSAKTVNKKLTIDSIYEVSKGDAIPFDTSGLYLIQEDTSSANGIGFRVETGRYPKYTKLASLIKPLVYISTGEEIKTLNKSTDTKKALDNYWLRLAGNANDAKRIIRVFYDRVEAANEKFTSYKEGWKTDMGMIYIVFGEPMEVYRRGDQEEWIYQKSEGMSEVKFTFTKVKNVYANNHYELIRNPEYEQHWYNKVDLWRKGTPGI
jgi:GWxTD domain-containing protein